MGEKNIICGVNPILEALRSGRFFEKIYVARGRKGKSIEEILALARSHGIDVRVEPKERIEHLAQRFQEGEDRGVQEHGNKENVPSSANRYPPTSQIIATQGILGITSPYRYLHLEELWKEIQGKNEPPFIVLLDGIEDPHNLGAIIRSAEGAGVHGIILPKRRSAGLTPVVAKVAAGALEYLSVCRVSNLASTLDQLKEYGLWIYGATPIKAKSLPGTKRSYPYYAVDLKGPVALVIGGESGGLKELTLKKSDFLLYIPLFGKVASLNASVAAGILMFEVRRQRGKEIIN